MKKLIFLFLLTVSVALFWLIEPFAYNPFYTPHIPVIGSDGNFACEQDSVGLNENVEDLLNGHMVSNDFLGVSAGVFKSGCGSYIASSGYSDKRNVTKFTPDTVTTISSIAKPMTAIAIMQLHENGLLNLDTPVQEYLPDLPKMRYRVTVRQILRQSNTMPDNAFESEPMSFSHFDPISSATNAMLDRGLVNEYRENAASCIYDLSILVKVIESVSNSTYSDYLSRHIWQTAGMVNTSLESRYTGANESKLYVKAGSLFLRSPYKHIAERNGAFDIRSSANDLLKFGQAILNFELLSKDTLEKMFEITSNYGYYDTNLQEKGYSLYKTTQLGRVISHDWNQPGAGAYFQVLLDKGVVSVAITNAVGTKDEALTLSTNIGNLVI
ncbi:serine hydrolase domain-containing protein [Agaribacter marinus]|uniref:Beta-lactamase-related domain-containing protein n=1 Tax=Agaribacter marinus TaxID=1431249 RepID=A0AA37SUH3_9ALTE|nr:serine hydrolase domain-containing protein [Agaribacter marinus]GLR69502.1 hypothetical protein GCM10007852_04100 [Agaribacter marinus]